MTAAVWRDDMENAPRDGTVIDLYGTRNQRPGRFPDARWSEDTSGGQRLGTYSWSHRGWDIYGAFNYTHWMLVPPPPKDRPDE